MVQSFVWFAIIFLCCPLLLTLLIVLLVVAYQRTEDRNGHIEEERVTTKEKALELNTILKSLRPLDCIDIYEDECPICFCALDEENPVVETGCEHIFHEACLVPWLMKKDTCPVCRECCAALP
jgi:hypothetical protein